MCSRLRALCMAQNEEVTFELLVNTGAKWEAQGVYAAHEQRTAVADARSLAKVSTVKGVKVVKEFYDAKAGASRSLTVYEHKQNQPAQTKPASRAKKAPNTSKASTVGDVREEQADTDAPQPKGNSFFAVLVKIMISVVFALIAAVVVTQLTSFALREVHAIGLLKKGDFLIAVFVLVFAITSLALITRILVGLKSIAPILKARPAAEPVPAKRTRNQRLTPSVDTYELQPLEAEKDDQEDGVETEAALKAEEDKRSEEAARLAAEEELNKLKEYTAKKDEADALSEIVTMNAFTQDAFDVLQGDKSKQDAHTVFGLVLFLVGAVQALRHQHKLSEDVAGTVIGQALGSLGLSKERAEHFVKHTDEYLISNPRYSQMFQNGRAAMGDYLDNNTGPRGLLSDALVDWDKPKSKKDVGSKLPVTVLFTDIAGSTAMTQELGDEGAQDVVRSHNRIVREAIQGFSGKEIKHTGDGIMASFPSAGAGVEAAMEMQKRTETHNQSDRGHPLGLKIGLNAGEPISEDDDLFGTTVQLAARIVDKASAGQILVSSLVHGLSQGKNIKFERFADLDMKGFDEPVSVYAVVLKEKLEVEPTANPQEKPELEQPQSSVVTNSPDVEGKTEEEVLPTSKDEPEPSVEPASKAEPAPKTEPASTQSTPDQATTKEKTASGQAAGEPSRK